MTKPEQVRIVLAGGGSGGHIYPLLALAEELRRRGDQYEVHYIGLRGGPEADLVPPAGLPFWPISAAKLHRHFNWSNFSMPFRLLGGIIESYRLLGRLRPALVICKGGYVSLPVAVAAWLRSLPIVVHESDTVMGLANRLAARIAVRVYTAFPAEFYPETLRPKVRPLGLPIAGELSAWEGVPADPLVLIIGASQGARRLNELIRPILPELLEVATVIHSTGPLDYPTFQPLKRQLKRAPYRYLPAAQLPHQQLLDLLPQVTLAVSRSGSGGIELLSAGVPTIFVPLSTSAADHQAHNAAYWTRHGAALAVNEQVATPDLLGRFILKLLADKAELTKLSHQACRLMPKNAVVAIVDDLVGPHPGQQKTDSGQSNLLD